MGPKFSSNAESALNYIGQEQAGQTPTPVPQLPKIQKFRLPSSEHTTQFYQQQATFNPQSTSLNNVQVASHF